MIRPLRSPRLTVVLGLCAGLLAAGPALAGGGGLDGAWQVTRLGDEPVGADAGLVLEFHGDRLSGFSGCNRFATTYRFAISDSGKQSVSIGPIRSTRKACAPDVMARETAMMRAIGTAHAMTRAADGAMETLSETGAVTMRFVQTQP